MFGTFPEHPLWHHFQGRNLWVVSLSEPEHRLRDAHALIDLREFLPSTRSRRCSFATVTLNPDGSASKWPTIPDDDGVVILGRPALFGEGARQLLGAAAPPLLFHFKSDQPGDPTGYRTIVRRGDDDEEPCPPFAAQRAAGGGRLRDEGIVYSGWSGTRPTVLLAGTSTVGTWGAVRYATEGPSARDDMRWGIEVQGTIEAKVAAGREAFDSVEAAPLEILAPARIWMSGGDLPPRLEWRNRRSLQLSKPGPNSGFDLRILINGKEVLPKATTHIPALVLLAWLGHKTPAAFPGGFVATVTPREVGKALYSFLGVATYALDLGPEHPIITSESDFFEHFKTHVRVTLRSLTAAIRRAGGIAFLKTDGDKELGENRYTICAGNLPHFLPAVG